MPWGERVTIVNRTSKPLSFMFDGMTYVLKPGENHGYQESIAGFAKSKFPVMGTEDPYQPTSFICLIGIPEWGDPITPLEQSDAIERLDRSLLPAPVTKEGKPAKVSTLAAKGGQWRPMVGDGPNASTSEFRGGDGTA